MLRNDKNIHKKLSIAVHIVLLVVLLVSGCGKVTDDVVEEDVKRAQVPPPLIMPEEENPTQDEQEETYVTPNTLEAPELWYYYLNEDDAIKIAWYEMNDPDLKEYKLVYKVPNGTSCNEVYLDQEVYVINDVVLGHYEFALAAVDYDDNCYWVPTISFEIEEKVTTFNLFGQSADESRFPNCWESINVDVPYSQEVAFVWSSDLYVNHAEIKLNDEYLINYTGQTNLQETVETRSLEEGSHKVSAAGICSPPFDPNSSFSYRAQCAIYGRDHGVRVKVLVKSFNMVK